MQGIYRLQYKRPHPAIWVTSAAVVDKCTLQPMALKFIGHLDIIDSVPIYFLLIIIISVIMTHNQTSCKSPE